MSNPVRTTAALSAATTLVATLLSFAGVAILTPVVSRALAAEPVAFSIPAEDGYGIAECMESGNSCGAVMADSWCVAHGHARSVAFGLSGDVTGTVPHGGADPSSEAVMIRCGD